MSIGVELLSATREQLIEEILRLRGELARVDTIISDVQAFHGKFGVGYTGKPRALDPSLGEFRREFLIEEATEYRRESGAAEFCVAQIAAGIGNHDTCLVHNLAESLDALVDIVYVAIGNSIMHGFNFREAWRRVHLANMQKERAPSAGHSKRGHAMDVIKPTGWQAPNHTDLVADHAHKGDR